MVEIPTSRKGGEKWGTLLQFGSLAGNEKSNPTLSHKTRQGWGNRVSPQDDIAGSFMQFAKDSFFLALQTRLGALNPARTVTINGATVPAVVVVENLPVTSAEPQPNAFYIEWGAASVVDGHSGNNALMSIECVISYYTLGTVQSMVDRGRLLGQLDDELLGICQPPNTEKMDYTQAPAADLGTKVFWTQPAYTEKTKSNVEDLASKHDDGRVERMVRLTVFFFSEVTLS
jgi:hypothetical protein